MSEVRRPKIFYGWFIVAAGFAILAANGGFFWVFGVFFKSLEAEFGWSRSMVSSGFTAVVLGFGASQLASGRFIDRHRPRPIFILSAILVGLGVWLSGRVHSLIEFQLYSFIAGLGGGINWSLAGATVQRWFYGRPRRGLALSTVVTGIGVGSLVSAPLVNFFITAYGWRNAYAILALICFTIVFSASFVMKPSPPAEPAFNDSSEPTAVRRWTIRRILRSPTFLGMTFILVMNLYPVNMVSVHLVAFARDIGVAPLVAASALGFIGGGSIPGRLLSGVIADKVGWQKVLLAALVGMMATVAWLLFVRNTWMLYVFVLLFGFTNGLLATAQVGILAQFFGTGSLGVLMGVTSAIGSLASAMAPYLAGYIFDATGQYFWAFLIAAAGLLLASGVALMLRRPVNGP